MKDSKLIYALGHLDVYELNRFKKFVKSPYFNSNEHIIKYFELIEKFLKTGKKEPTKQKLFSSVYGGKVAYKDSKFRKLNTELLSLFEEFLSMENFSSKKLTKVNYLLSALREKRIEKLYNSILEKSKRYSEQSFSKTSDFYFEQFNLQKNIFNLTSEFERKAKSKAILSNFNIPEISYNLDLFYIIEKLRYMCTVLSWQSVRHQKIEINFIDDIIKIVENSALLRNRVVEIYYQIYKTYVNEEDESHFFKLKVLIKNYLNIFPLDEAKNIFEAAFTYCTKKINKGQSHFQSEVLELYKEALESELLLVDGYLSPTSIRNIMIYALRAKEFDWAEAFVNKYKDRINPKFRESIINYNMAMLKFYKKDFSQVIQHLISFEYDEAHYSLGAKSILLATYYELEEEEALYSLLDSFRVYIDRNPKIIERNKNSYRYLISFVRKLLKIDSKNKEAIAKLKKEVLESSVASKKWLVEKVEELEK